MIRCLVFDFDGTLVPSNAIKRAAYFETVADFPEAVARAREIVAANPGYDRFTVFTQLAAEFPDVGQADALAARYGAICEAQILPLLQHGPTRDVIAALNALGVPCHIATATPGPAILRLLDRAHMTQAFSSIHGSPKTKTAALAEIATAEGYRNDEVAMIGDGNNDHTAANEFGCPFVQIDGDAPQLFAAPTDAIAFLRQALPSSIAAEVL